MKSQDGAANINREKSIIDIVNLNQSKNKKAPEL